MPSWSGLHMWWTISTGHSSRSSSSRSTSSGRRFLAKSFSDFKLSFRVLFAIIGIASLCCSFCCERAHLANFVGQFRQELQNVIDNSDISHLKDRSLRILVNGDQEWTAFNAGQMLESATDAACQIDLGLDSFSG